MKKASSGVAFAAAGLALSTVALGSLAYFGLRARRAPLGLAAAPRSAIAVAWVDQERLRGGSLEARVQRAFARHAERAQRQVRVRQGCGTDPVRDGRGLTFFLLERPTAQRSAPPGMGAVVGATVRPLDLARCVATLADSQPQGTSTVQVHPLAPVGGHLALSLEPRAGRPISLAAFSNALVATDPGSLPEAVAALDGAPSANDNPLLREAASSLGPDALVSAVVDLGTARARSPELATSSAIPLVGAALSARWAALGLAPQGDALTLRLRFGFETDAQTAQSLQSLQGSLAMARLLGGLQLGAMQREWARFMAPRVAAQPELAPHLGSGQQVLALAGVLLQRLQPATQQRVLTLDVALASTELDTVEQAVEAVVALANAPAPPPEPAAQPAAPIFNFNP